MHRGVRIKDLFEEEMDYQVFLGILKSEGTIRGQTRAPSKGHFTENNQHQVSGTIKFP